MKYHYISGVEGSKRRNPLFVVLPVISLFAGGYLLVNTLYPSLPVDVTGQASAVTKVLTQRQPDLSQDRLYVPKIGVDVAIVTGVDDKTLEGGAWHRVPENGDPMSGGNFVLAAHRFNLGLTPQQTRARSPFYHIDDLNQGDEIYVDFHGVRYAYSVTKRYKVSETEVAIESATKDARLTMYSCDLRGSKAGREVVEAKPVGTVAWLDGAPKLKQLQ
ncbi:MAG: sortase [Candidatus Saccharimonadales bacterium]